jgi:hypothetical protein
VASSRFQIVFEAVTGPLERGFQKASKSADELTGDLQRVEGQSLDVREATIKVEQAQRRASRAVERYGKDSLQAAAAQVRLERAQERASAAISDGGRKADRAGRGLGGLSTAARTAGASLVAAAGAGGFGAMVQAASSVQESLSKNQTLFGRYAKDVEAFSRSAANSFGISQRAALEYTGVFGNLARATGISEQQSAKLSVQLTKLGADLASFNNTSIEDALGALQSGLVGESEPLRRFGVTLSANAVAAEAMRSGIVKVTKSSLEYRQAALAVEKAQVAQATAVRKYGADSIQAREATLGLEVANKNLTKAAAGGKVQLTDQQKALATINLTMRQTKQAQGDVARTADSLANQQRRATANFDNFQVALGTRLIPVMTRAITVGGSLLTSIRSFVQRFREGETRAVALGAAVAGLATAFGVYKTVGLLTGAIKGLSLAMATNPIVAVGAALVGLGVALTIAYKKSETFRNIVQAAFRGVLTVIRETIQFALGALDKLLGGFSSVLSAASKIPGVGGKFKKAAEGIDSAREKLRDLSEKVDGLGRKKITIRVGVDNAQVDALGRVLEGPKNDGIGRTPGRGSGSLRGANSALAPLAAVGARRGLSVSSGFRPGSITSSGNVSYHSTGEALDLAGSPAGMMSTFKTLKARFGSQLAELIYTPGGVGIRNGRPHTYTGKVAADHYDHVHVALDLGRPGPGIGLGGRTGDGPGRYDKAALMDLWSRAGGPAAQANLAASVALAESGGDPKADPKNTDGSIDRGLWQINSIHGALSTFNPLGNARAAVKISSRGKNWSPWVAWKKGAHRQYLDDPPTTLRSALAKLGRSGRTTSGGGGRSTSTMSGLRPSDPLQSGGRGDDGSAMTLIGGTNAAGGPIAINPDEAVEAGTARADANRDLESRTPTVNDRARAGADARLRPTTVAAALAQLTSGLDDDIAAQQARATIAEQELGAALARGDGDAVIQLAGELKAARDAIAELTGAVEAERQAREEADRRTQQLIDLTQQQVDNQNRAFAFMQNEQKALSSAVSAVVSGDIGGRLALGFQTPGFAGGGVRY